MLTASHLPPAHVPNDAVVFPEGKASGTTVHTYRRCPAFVLSAAGREPVLRRCTAIQAAVYLAPRWCPICAGRRS